MQITSRRQSRSGHRRTAVVVGVALALVTSTLSSAAPSAGFPDGTWGGTIVWVASAQFPEAFASSRAGGIFDVTYSGGIPDGAFDFLADASGDTTDASADLILSVSGTVEGTAELPMLVAADANVSGTVTADGFPEPIPVALGLDTGRMVPFVLDVRRAGCTFVSGNLDAEISQLTGQVSGAGGTLDVARASWSAVRTGSEGATTPEQRAVLDQLVNDGITIGLEVEGGYFDPDELEGLMSRASAFASSIKRNADCGIGDADHYSTAVAGLIADLLVKMIASADWLSAEDFAQAISAGIAAGVLGSNGGVPGDKLASQLLDILVIKLAEAVGADDRTAMLIIAHAAGSLGDTALSSKAMAAWTS